jgi:hypothetical protein
MMPSLNSGTSPKPGDEAPDDRRAEEDNAVPASPISVHPVGMAINRSHNSGVGISFGFRCTTALTAISWSQFMLPLTPLFVRFLHRPLGRRMKSSGLQSFTRIAVDVGVVTVEE